MTNSIEYSGKIDRRNLSEEHYFVSLMNSAIDMDMVTSSQELELKAGCGSLLGFCVNRYTDGQSSSVPSEIARELLNSIYYTLGLGLKACGEPDSAVEFLLTQGVNEVYTKGKSVQKELLLKAKRVYQNLAGNFEDYGCLYYNLTVRKALSGFFKKYIPDSNRLFAQDIIITADYPVYYTAKPTQGIEFVKNYIEQLYCENAFCTLFSEDCVTQLLYSYDRSYKKVLFNVFELVYTRALGRIICGEEPLSLELPSDYHQKLTSAFEGKRKSEIVAILKNALQTLGGFIELKGAALKYTELCIPATATGIVTAARMGVIKRIFF